MLNVNNLRVLHRHGDDWIPMESAEHTSPAAHDPERRILRGQRIYRCASCDEEVLIGEAAEE